MKRLFHLLIALSCTLFMGCGSDNKGIDEPDEPVNPVDVTLEISTTDLSFEAEGGKKEFTITCNTNWTLSNGSTWCQTDVTSGNGNKTVTVTAAVSTETADRNTNLTVKAGDKTKVLTVTQKPTNAIILSKNKFDIPQEGGDITVELKNGIDYQLTIPSDYQTWIKRTETRAAESQSVSFSIAANEGTDKREGYILFHGNTLKDTVFIYQAPKNQLVLTENTYTISAEGGKFTVELKTNIDYNIQIPGDAASWVSLITTRALRTDRLIFRVEANTGSADRSAKITVNDKNSDLSDTIIIIQPIKRADIVWETEQDLIDFKNAGYTCIQANITVQGNEIKTLQKLDNLLTEIDGTLTLNCSSLTSLDGLYGLTKITDSLIIKSGRMTSIEGLNNLQTIGGDFKVISYYSSSLTALKSFKGLGSLKSIGGNFEINTSSPSSLTALESFEGLENLQTIGGDFKVIASYSSLTALKSFKGLSSLKSIGGNFEINASSSYYYYLTALESFEGLENLTTIGGKKLTVMNCRKLNNITALDNVEAIDEISITGCSALYDFCVLKNVVQDMSGTFYVNGNGYNPTKYQLLNGACSQTPPDDTDNNN